MEMLVRLIIINYRNFNGILSVRYLIYIVGIMEDFVEPAQLEVTFTNGNSKCVTFEIVDDDLLEGDHSFTVSIIEADDVGIDSQSSSTTITIIDDERK